MRAALNRSSCLLGSPVSSVARAGMALWPKFVSSLCATPHVEPSQQDSSARRWPSQRHKHSPAGAVDAKIPTVVGPHKQRALLRLPSAVGLCEARKLPDERAFFRAQELPLSGLVVVAVGIVGAVTAPTVSLPATTTAGCLFGPQEAAPAP